MKRVCHLTSVHSSDDTRVFHKECVSLAHAGYDVTLVAPGESREELGVHVIGVGEKPAGTLNRLASPFARHAYETALALDCELYHLHDPELLPFARRLKRHGKTVIFDSHEFYALLIQEKSYIPGFLKKPASRVYGALEASVFQKIDAVIIPCTSYGKNPFEKCAKRTVIVDNLPDAGRFPPPKPLYPDAENAVGYVGGITRERGITRLVQACALAGVRLRLAGPVWPAYLEELQSMPEYSCVDYAGVVPYAEVPEFCRHFSIGMATLLRLHQYTCTDNLSTKAYEYMGAGLPVILADKPSTRAFMKEVDCALAVDPDNPSEIAAAIRSLLDDPERRAAMGERGYSALQSRFNWQTEEKKLLALYEELLPLKGE
mgnify:CR=1 FL=1